jgi:hypothetical protein
LLILHSPHPETPFDQPRYKAQTLCAVHTLARGLFMQNTKTYAALAVAAALGLAAAATPASAQWYHGGMHVPHWGGIHGYGGWRVAGGWHRPWGYGYRGWGGYGAGVGYGLGYAHYGCGYGCGGYAAYAVPQVSYVPTYEITTTYVPAVTGYSYGASGCGCGW